MDLRTLSRMVMVGAIALAWGGIAFGGDGATVQDSVDAAPSPGPGAHERIEEIQRRIQSALVYPELARRHGVTGVVRLRFEVGGQGRARNIELARSSGSGTPQLISRVIARWGTSSSMLVTKSPTFGFQLCFEIQSARKSRRRLGRSRYQCRVDRTSGVPPQMRQTGDSSRSASIQVPHAGHSSPRAFS